MKYIIHKIAHWLGWNYGNAHSWYEGEKLVMSFKCSGCGEISGVHPINDVVDRELKTNPSTK